MVAANVPILSIARSVDARAASDRAYLRDLAAALESADIEGAIADAPEGSGSIRISVTLRREITARLRSIAGAA